MEVPFRMEPFSVIPEVIPQQPIAGTPRGEREAL
jgi:hypothetical protein